MKKIDHRRLAVFWTEAAGVELPRLCQLAFIYGSFEPDVNYLTYLHGFFRHGRFRGHNYRNIIPTLLRMLERDAGKPLTLLRCFRLGKCFHYVADIFTFPHNETFPGTIGDHIQYELTLHARWDDALRACRPRLRPSPADGKALGDALLTLHRQYIAGQGGPERDCEYILNATRILLEVCLLPRHEEVSYENIAHHGLLLPHC